MEMVIFSGVIYMFLCTLTWHRMAECNLAKIVTLKSLLIPFPVDIFFGPQVCALACVTLMC